MNVAFRTDASVEAGTGHVMRCLTLANTLSQQGASCHFLCREHPGHLADKVRDADHRVTLLDSPTTAFALSDASRHALWLGATMEMDAAQSIDALGDEPVDWLVVDQYGIDLQWETMVRPYAKRIMVIDDLADRRHDCDVLLDQNLGRHEGHYKALCAPDTRLLLGPQFALLRPEFTEWREWALTNRSTSRQILVSLGGTDWSNATAKVLQEINEVPLSKEWSILVVLGPSCPHIEQIRVMVRTMNVETKLLVGANNMAELMASCAFSVGASGSTSWERCCLGLPTLMLVTAENQRAIADTLVAAKAAQMFSREAFVALSDTGPSGRALRFEMGRRAATLCDGSGAQRARDAMTASCDELGARVDPALNTER